MTDLKIPTLERWEDLPERIEALRRTALDHQEKSEDCGDHDTEACSCGAPRNVTMPSEIFDAGPESRKAWRSDRLSERHAFRWQDHFAAEWNEAVAKVGLG